MFCGWTFEEVPIMEIFSERMGLERGACKTMTCNVDGRRGRSVGAVSGNASRSVAQPDDPFADLDAVRSMEERYGIRDEGLF